MRKGLQGLGVLIVFAILSACGKSTPPPPAEPVSAVRKEIPGQEQPERMAKEHAHDDAAPSAAAGVAPAQEVIGQMETYATINGKDIQGYIAFPAAAEGALPGVLVFHEWWGLNDNVKAMANRLAGEGYAVLAADFYSGRAATAPDQAQALMQEATAKPDAIAANIRQAHEFLRDHLKATGVASLGWCFGGSIRLLRLILPAFGGMLVAGVGVLLFWPAAP